MYISKIKVGNTIYDIKAGENNVLANWTESDTTSDAYIQNKPTIITTADINELFGLVSTQGSAPTLINSNNLDQAVGDAGYIKGSDLASWAKQSTKPSYAYSEIGYTVNATSSAGGTLSLAGTTPLHVITLTGNVSAVTLSTNPAEGHSCHVIFTAASAQTVAIAHDSTNRVCPGAADLSLDVPAGGYVEIDFLAANNKVYVRGV